MKVFGQGQHVRFSEYNVYPSRLCSALSTLYFVLNVFCGETQGLILHSRLLLVWKSIIELLVMCSMI